MTALSRLLALLLVSSTAAAGEKQWVFLGTSTKDGSKGIYRGEFDPATGTLSEPQLAAEVVNPTFLAVHPSRKYLYSIGEVNSVGGKKGGGVHAFAIDAKTGSLTKLNENDSQGAGPAHITVDPSGQCLLVANYGGGSVKCLKLNADGSIGTESSFVQHAGHSINPNRQKEPHAHSINPSPDGKFAICADLGLDKLLVYKLDAKSAKLTPNDPPAFDIAPGSGPRHFAWHPNGKWAYTNGELNATVHALEYDAEKGIFKHLGTAATLPAETSDDVRKKNSTAEIVVHPNGKTLFVSNRGHDSIAIFAIDGSGVLAPAGHITGDIKTPRNFNIDPSGKWILVANQEGGSVTIFKWDEAVGKADATGKKIAIARPMCIKFVSME